MFSSRTHWNLTPNRLSDLVFEKRLRGERMIDLTESNPTRCGFSYPGNVILDALADESALAYDPEPRGLLTARQAIAEYYATRGISVQPEQIVLTASTSEAYSFLFKLLCNAGDEILVPRPSYPLFDYLGQLNDIALRHYNLSYDGDWHTDFESFESSYTDRVRAVVLVHPNNPTGSYIQQKDFDTICSFAAAHQCALIIDEVFESYTLNPDDIHPQLLTSEISALSFSLNGVSKILGLPQLKCSWIVVSGCSPHTKDALNRLDIIADTFLSVNTPAQVALPKLLKQSHTIQDQIRKRIRANFLHLTELFAESSITVLRSEGGWSAILQLPQFHSDEDWAIELLRQQNILAYPGHFFDLLQPSCLVISLLPLPDVFADALARMLLVAEYS